jgi:hypothetical protein
MDYLGVMLYLDALWLMKEFAVVDFTCDEQ